MCFSSLNFNINRPNLLLGLVCLQYNSLTRFPPGSMIVFIFMGIFLLHYTRIVISNLILKL